MKSIAKKLAETAAECGFAEFDATNKSQKYSYATAASVIRMINRSLTSRGVAVSSDPELVRYEVTNDGKGAHAIIRESLTFVDSETGETLVSKGYGEGKDWGDKAVMKASTAAYKYALAHAFIMAWGAVDPEADEEISKEPEKPREGRTRRPSARRSGKAAAPACAGPAEALLEKIRGSDMAGLVALKPEVLAFRGKECYEKLVEAWKERNETLRAVE